LVKNIIRRNTTYRGKFYVTPMKVLNIKDENKIILKFK